MSVYVICPRCNAELLLPRVAAIGADVPCDKCSEAFTVSSRTTFYKGKGQLPANKGRAVIKLVNVFAVLTLVGSILTGLVIMAASDASLTDRVLGIAFIIEGIFVYAICSLLCNMADNVREIKNEIRKWVKE